MAYGRKSKTTRIASSDGYAALLITGMVALMLIAATVGINGVIYYEQKSQLKTISKSVAGYAATFLPNPYDAALQGFRYWSAIKDLELSPSSNPKIYIYITSAAGDAVSVTGGTTPASIPIGKESDIPQKIADGIHAALPIKSITVRIESNPNIELLGSFLGALSPSISAESTAHLAPTDIVLVVENSNSLISTLENEDSLIGPIGNTQFGQSPGWDMWTPRNLCRRCITTNTSTNWGSPECSRKLCAPKYLRYARQCFGKVGYDIKRGALTLYDLLSSSGTYRVAVVHNTTAGAEQAHVAVPFGIHPTWINKDQDKANNLTNQNYPYYGINVDPHISSTGTPDGDKEPTRLEEVYGLSDHPSTRCARLTEGAQDSEGHAISTFETPSHPLINLLQNSGSSNSPIPRLGSISSYYAGAMPDHDYASTLDPFKHLRFKTNKPGRFSNGGELLASPGAPDAVRLLPRDIIWMKNAGYSYDSGLPIPRYTYSTMQFGIMRATDLLYNAPARVDKLPVRRRIVLTLTDGFETISPSDNPTPGDGSVAVGQKLLKTFLEPRVTISNLTPGTNPPLIGNITATNSMRDFCADAKFPNITVPPSSPFNTELSTVVPLIPFGPTSLNLEQIQMHQGFKLGILRYGFGGTSYSDPNDTFQKKLYFHDDASAKLELGKCIQKNNSLQMWAMRRGRFWGESAENMQWQSSMFSDAYLDYSLGESKGYYSTLAPMVARTIFVPEISQ